jgi:hypothetical protein
MRGIFVALVLVCAAGLHGAHAQVTKAQHGLSVDTQGSPLDLHLEGGTLTFCDKRGARKLDLKSGRESASEQACRAQSEGNTSCDGLSLDVTVRTPMSEPNDIVDFSGWSLPLAGHVNDCAAMGKMLAIVTASSVMVVDSHTEKARNLSRQGGERVVIGAEWVVWSNGTTLRAVAIGRP